LVANFDIISVEDVEITNCPDRDLLVGEEWDFEMITDPFDALNQTVIWESINPNIAIIEQDGHLIAMGAGITAIVVTTLDGSFTDTCYIKVVLPVADILLNKKAITLLVAEEETLVATILPENASNQNVEWSVVDDNIATVDANGKVKGIAVGTTIVTVTTVDGGFFAECEVTVIEDIVLPTSIILTPKTHTLDVDTDYELQVQLTPSNASTILTWISSNDDIVSVEDGVITGNAGGKATITVKTINGLSAICNVTVVVPVKSVVVTPDEWLLPLKGTKLLKADIFPLDATDKTITWSSGSPDIATVNAAGLVTAKSVNGIVEIYATAHNGEYGVCLIVVGTGDATVSIDEQDLEDIMIYPNPTMGTFVIKNYRSEMGNVELVDIMGRTVETNLRVNPELNTVDISYLSPGVYFIRIKNDTDVIIRKVVKQ
jgi:uncharacterized protein YjdB